MPHGHVDDYLQAAGVAGALLRSPAVGAHWDEASALVDWSVAGLAGHLARSVFTIESALTSSVDPGKAVIDAVTYYAGVPDEDLQPVSKVSTQIRVRGIESAGTGHADLVGRYESGLGHLRQALPACDPAQPVVMFGRTLPLVECLRTRTLELVVHADDLATSTNQPAPEFPPSVCEDVIAVLAAVATRRRGPLAVLRALARPERVTGRIAAF